jgi:hypothetical protein
MSTKSYPPLTDGLAGTTSELLEQLDQRVHAPVVTINHDLNDPRVRHDLAVEAGRRSLVDQLITIHRRKLTEV